MQIYFHCHFCSYLSREPILVEGTVHFYNIIFMILYKDLNNKNHPKKYSIFRLCKELKIFVFATKNLSYSVVFF